MIESGQYSKWTKDILQFFDNYGQFSEEMKSNYEFEIINLRQIYDIFIVLSIGYFISTIVFVFEIYIYIIYWINLYNF